MYYYPPYFGFCQYGGLIRVVTKTGGVLMASP